MFDRIGDVDVFVAKSGVVHRPAQQPSGRPDEGHALPILLVARLLADEQQARLRRSAPGDALCRAFPQRTAAATIDVVFARERHLAGGLAT
jgi:hypothetical protein